jgi:phage shock protein PspC (stress-responsive transcriptional regulator)
MQSSHAPAAKLDNLLGICHTVGETFGFNPLFLRVALILAFMVNAPLALGLYALMGIATLAGVVGTLRFRRRKLVSDDRRVLA